MSEQQTHRAESSSSSAPPPPASAPISSAISSSAIESAAPPPSLANLPIAVALARRRLRAILSVGAKVLWAAACLQSAILHYLIGNRPIGYDPLIEIIIAIILGIGSIGCTWPSGYDDDAHLDLREDGALYLRSKRVTRAIRREDVASAYISASNLDRTIVEVDLRRGDFLYLRVANVKIGERIVDALGFGSHGRRVRINLDWPRRRVLNMTFAIVSFVTAHWISKAYFPDVVPASMHVLLVLVMYEALRFFARPNLITVGSDGVILGRFWRSRVRGADIAALEPDAKHGMKIVKGDGSSLRVRGFEASRRNAAAMLLEARFGKATMASHKDEAERASSAAAFARNGRSVRAWREHLSALSRGSDYRASALRSSGAEDVLANPRASVEERVGVALAIMVAEPEQKERVRIAAEAAIDPKTRELLEAIAAADDDRAERVMKKMQHRR